MSVWWHIFQNFARGRRLWDYEFYANTAGYGGFGRVKIENFSLKEKCAFLCVSCSFRLAAVNDCGKSPYSDIITFCTAANPPPQPTPPTLAAATSSSLRLEWIRRSQEEEYVLQMADKESGHGYLPMYTGRETVYECVNLRRATVFHFRLKAENEVSAISFFLRALTDLIISREMA